MYTILEKCLKTTCGFLNLSAVIAANVCVVLPLCALIIYISVRRWLQSSSVALSHSDHFTYQTLISEFLSFTGMILSGFGGRAHHTPMTFVGLFFFSLTTLVQMFIDTLTCVERYLAVVHPITYRNLKNAQGACVRNVAIGCSWLLSFSVAGFLFINGEHTMTLVLLPVTLSSLTLVLFCSLCVLCVLIRPGPGEGGQVRQQVDQSKLRAFYIILLILAVMLIRLGAIVFITVLYTTLNAEDIEKCVLSYPLFWSSFPATVMPFAHFLQRQGNISVCRNIK